MLVLSRLKAYNFAEPMGLIFILVILFLLFFGATLAVGFELIDDHEILQPFLPESQAAFQANFVQFVTDYVFEPGLGRWRPFYRGVRLVETWLLGPHPLPWRIVVWSMSIATLVLLYLALRRLGISFAIAGFCLLGIALYRGVTSIWYTLGPAELLGTLLTAAALYAMVRASQRSRANRWDAAMLILLVLAANTKESFILTIPAFLLMRWALQCYYQQQSWRQALVSLRVPFILSV